MVFYNVGRCDVDGAVEDVNGRVAVLGPGVHRHVRSREQQHPGHLRPPELQLNMPAHTKHPGWFVGMEFRVTHPLRLEAVVGLRDYLKPAGRRRRRQRLPDQRLVVQLALCPPGGPGHTKSSNQPGCFV